MKIRVLTYNIHKCIGWGIKKSTLKIMHKNICDLHSDIILLQEVRGIQFEVLSSRLWPHFSYGKNAVSPKGHYGNAILSKFPIRMAENINLTMSKHEKRGMLHSIILIPGQTHCTHIFCVHLSLFKSARMKQLKLIAKFIQSNVSDDESFILGGDFNDWNCAATRLLMNENGMKEAFLNRYGHLPRTYPAWAPVLKLDRLYYRGFNVDYAHRLIDKNWRYLSDHIALEVHLNMKPPIDQTGDI